MDKERGMLLRKYVKGEITRSTLRERGFENTFTFSVDSVNWDFALLSRRWKARIVPRVNMVAPRSAKR